MRMLILGASGLIGRHVLARLGPDQAVGTYLNRPFTGGIRYSMSQDAARDVVSAAGGGFSHVLIAAAATGIDHCARDPVASHETNVAAVIRRSDEFRALGLQVIFTSSDGVYTGAGALCLETDAVAPVMLYARQKHTVERHLLDTGAPSIVLRLAKVLDPGLSPQGVLGPWAEALRRGSSIRCARDQRFTPVGIDDVVTAITALADTDRPGLYNVGGPDAVSRDALLGQLVEAMAGHGSITPRIELCMLADLGLLEPRPQDTAMSIAKLQAAIFFQPQPMAALCRQAAAAAFAPSDQAG